MDAKDDRHALQEVYKNYRSIFASNWPASHGYVGRRTGFSRYRSTFSIFPSNWPGPHGYVWPVEGFHKKGLTPQDGNMYDVRRILASQKINTVDRTSRLSIDFIDFS